MYLLSVVILAGILIAVAVFFYKIYEILWNAVKIPLKKPRMKLDIGRRSYTLIRNVFLQAKLFKDPYAGIMHALMFWGFVVFGAYSVDFFYVSIFSAQLFSVGILTDLIFFTVNIFAFVVIVDVIYAAIRRWGIKVKRYQGYNGFEAYFILILIGLLMTTYFIMSVLNAQGLLSGYIGVLHTGVPTSLQPITYALASIIPKAPASYVYYIFWISYWIHALDFMIFLIYIPRSKHLHLFAAPLNVLFSTGTQATPLPIDFDKETRFGATDIRDFTWKDYFDFYSCTECGRCTDNCPANMTGKTLSPRDIIWDIRETVMAQGKEYRNKHGNPDEVFKTVIGDPIKEDDLWSCTTCMACVEQCPVMIDHVPKIIDMRRSLVLNQGKAPKEALDLFRNIEGYSSPYSIDPSTRGDWAEGLDVVDLSKTPDADYDVLYWVGCVASFDRRNQDIAKSVTKILKKAGVRFAILGGEEKCTGDPARRAGNEYLADMMIKQNVEIFKEKKIQKVITACPHCFNSLKNEYKEYGVELEVYHHSEYINRLISDKKITVKALTSDENEKYTYHDSCYLGRYNKIYDSPREIISSFTSNYEEMEMNKSKSLCCGAGGGRLWMQEKEGTMISHKRIEMADKVKASTVVTACPYCMTMLDDARKTTNKEEKMNIQDLSEVIAKRID
ncbi:MAG: heterodisulfide reductase-related iron-sulfur binding cluster [Thermoplasmataceae archaeon]